MRMPDALSSRKGIADEDPPGGPQDIRIDPDSLAFDIDGVVADTMHLFLDIAREEFGVFHVRYEDITSYNLLECLDMEPPVIEAVAEKIMNGGYKPILKPISGAVSVLTRLGQNHGPVLFVTARPYPGPIADWLQTTLRIGSERYEIVTTGSFDAKAEILNERGIRFFIEDRLETCFQLAENGIVPIVFRQPWNREPHPFSEAGSWGELQSMIAFP